MSTLTLIYRMLAEHVSVAAILAGPVLLAAGIMTNRRLPAPAVLAWAPFRLRANVTLLPMRTRAWPAYTLLLAAAIPAIATLEEIVFRLPVHSVLTGVMWGGVAFGFAHLTSLVSLRMCLYLTVIGLVLVGVYVLFGFWAAVTLHASYNLSALALAAAERTGHLGGYLTEKETQT